MKDAVLAVYGQATEREREAGMRWYRDAHAHARAIAEEAGISVADAAALIAVLSPQKEWNQNLRLARATATTRRPGGHFGERLARAARILRGAERRSATIGDGQKTRAFYANIVRPGNPFAVTIDRHAVAAAMPDAPVVEHRRALKRKGGYQAIADAYRGAAREAGILPSELQAVVWLTWKRLKKERGRQHGAGAAMENGRRVARGRRATRRIVAQRKPNARGASAAASRIRRAGGVGGS